MKWYTISTPTCSNMEMPIIILQIWKQPKIIKERYAGFVSSELYHKLNISGFHWLIEITNGKVNTRNKLKISLILIKNVYSQ